MPEEAVLKLLAERNWRLWCAERGGGYFVTSDRPMVLMWREAHPVGFRPGFAHRDTHVIFPLTKQLLLYGSYDRDSTLIEADRDTIAVANHAIVGTCDRFIYSTDASFSEMSGSATTQSPGEYLRTRLW